MFTAWSPVHSKPISKRFRHERIHGLCTLLRAPESELQKNNASMSCHFFLPKIEARFGNPELDALTTNEEWGFLTQRTDGTSQGAKKLRHSLLPFFQLREEHPRSRPSQTLRYARAQEDLRSPEARRRVILDVVDDIISRTDNPGNRLILELMARSGMLIGEVLSLRGKDIEDRRVSLTHPKSRVPYLSKTGHSVGSGTAGIAERSMSEICFRVDNKIMLDWIPFTLPYIMLMGLRVFYPRFFVPHPPVP